MQDQTHEKIFEIFWICNQEWCKIKHMRKSLKYSEFATKSDARSNTWENLWNILNLQPRVMQDQTHEKIFEIFWICNQEWCKIKHMRKSLKYSEFATKSDARSNTWENLCIQMWSGSHPHKLKSLPSTLITIAHMEIGATVQELKISITQKKGLKQKSNTSVQEALFFFLSKSDFGFLPVVTFFCWLVYNEGTTISVLTSTKEQKHVILNTINTHIIEQFTDRFLPQLKSKQKQTKNLYRLNQLITQAILKQSDAQQKGISFWQRSMVIHKQILFQ